MKKLNGWRLFVVVAASLGLIALGACEGSSGDGNGAVDTGGGGGGGGVDTGGGGADTGGGGGGTTFEAGTFQLTTYEVTDGCLDGGLAILFQPTGVGTPYDLANTTEFPAYATLPSTFTMALQAPFTDMQVTMDADGANKMKVENSTQTDLVVDAANYGDCNVDMLINAAIDIVDSDNVDVQATIAASGWTGDQCPVVTADPCTITLTMKGVRLP